MTVKTSISLTDQQAAFARQLVKDGRYSSLSAVAQQGLEMLRRQEALDEAEIEAFREMLTERAKGPFLSAEEFSVEVEDMLKEMRRDYGLDE